MTVSSVKPSYTNRSALLSHNSKTCTMLVWAAACYNNGAELVFFEEDDKKCPDCGELGSINSTPSVHSSDLSDFFGGLVPKPGKMLIIREAGGNHWQYHSIA